MLFWSPCEDACLRVGSDVMMQHQTEDSRNLNYLLIMSHQESALRNTGRQPSTMRETRMFRWVHCQSGIQILPGCEMPWRLLLVGGEHMLKRKLLRFYQSNQALRGLNPPACTCIDRGLWTHGRGRIRAPDAVACTAFRRAHLQLLGASALPTACSCTPPG